MLRGKPPATDTEQDGEDRGTPVTFSGDGGSRVQGFGAEVAQHVVHSLVVPEEAGPDDILVEHLRPVPGHGGHAPQQEQALRGGETLQSWKMAGQAAAERGRPQKRGR